MMNSGEGRLKSGLEGDQLAVSKMILELKDH